jgi:DNA helicase-2/ATP-dependent DNA helicase PcrA
LLSVGQLLQGWVQLREQLNVGDLLDTVLNQIDYRSYIDDGTPEGADRWENVMELRSVTAVDESLSLSQFLQQTALVSETDNLQDAANTPTLLTLHAAKGLEFPVVFITGLEDLPAPWIVFIFPTPSAAPSGVIALSPCHRAL